MQPPIRATLLALLVAAAFVVVLPPAVARAEPAGVTLLGHGYGHGRGMGQYGALGYAVDYNAPYQNILSHFYGGTSAGYVPAAELMSVNLVGLAGVNDITVTSWADFFVSGILIAGGNGAHLVRVTGGWRVTVRASGCYGTDTGSPGTVMPEVHTYSVSDPGNNPDAMLRICNTVTTYRGYFQFKIISGSTRVVNVVALEDYLKGVVPRESPSSWGALGEGRGMHALYAQSVAARSYSMSENRTFYAKTCDTTSCQVYEGISRGTTLLETGPTNQAVDTTAGEVRRGSTGSIVRTEFSSSSGGYTAGGAFPAIVDLGDTRSPNHNWQVTLSADQISRAWPSIGTFRELRVLSRNGLGAEGGRVLQIQVIGSNGSVTVTGSDFRSAMALKSDWFTPQSPTALMLQIRGSPGPGPADWSYAFGGPNATALACDFNADGRDDVVAYDEGIWYVRFSPTPGPAELIFRFGAAGMTPVCGNWDGAGGDGIAVYRQGTWYLRYTADGGTSDAIFNFGWDGPTPVVGDWDGNGSDEIGVYHQPGGEWFLRDSISPGPADHYIQYGWSAAAAIPGDWNGDGTTELGVFAFGLWHLRGSLTAGPADWTFAYGGSTDQPFAGDFEAADRDTCGVARPV